MGNWFIKLEDRFYVYEKKGLHRLHMPPETEQILEESVFGGGSGRTVKIDQSMTDRLLRMTAAGKSGQQPRCITAASRSGQESHCITAASIRIAENNPFPVPGGWQMLHFDNAKSVLFRNVTPLNYTELLAAADEGLAERDDLLLDIYADHMAAASRAQAEEAGNPEAKTVILLNSAAKRIAEPKELLSDYSLEAGELAEVLTCGNEVDWTEMLDALERLESCIVPDFLVRSKEWLQMPYKITESEDGYFYTGELGAEQMVYASCRNLEQLLEQINPDATWLVVAGPGHGLKRLAQLILESEAIRPGRIERRVIPFSNLTQDKRIHAMIKRFVPDAERIHIHVDHAAGTPLWSAAAGYGEEVWTDKVYATTAEQVVHEALIRFYAMVRQNGIRSGGPGISRVAEPGEITGCTEVLSCHTAEYLNALICGTYEVGFMQVPLLRESGIMIIRLCGKGRGRA
ncbi:MAG: hypothetical protein LBJ26_10495 [Paenibacillus sp.]|jgi:hypothetical protein|nr:hypothetical protein [Paenibacillus sp.]